MDRRAQRADPARGADGVARGSELDALLLEALRRPEPAAADGASGESGVKLLDVEVDGVRYILFRQEARGEGRVSLSPREREIVRLIARGLPNKAIADLLDVSLWTVATHLRRVFGKLGVSSRAEMVARALSAGLLAPDDR